MKLEFYENQNMGSPIWWKILKFEIIVIEISWECHKRINFAKSSFHTKFQCYHKRPKMEPLTFWSSLMIKWCPWLPGIKFPITWFSDLGLEGNVKVKKFKKQKNCGKFAETHGKLEGKKILNFALFGALQLIWVLNQQFACNTWQPLSSRKYLQRDNSIWGKL